MRSRKTVSVVFGLFIMAMSAFTRDTARADFVAALAAQEQSNLNAMYTACETDAARGEPKCLNVIGVLFKIGRGGASKDTEHAAKLFKKSCEAGYWKGCANLGGLYSTGIGVARDPESGAQYIDKAYQTVENIHVDVHPAMLVRAATAYMELENSDRLKALEGYVKYMNIALGLKSSVYGKFDADKGTYLTEHQNTLERRKWFVTVARLRKGGVVTLDGSPSPSLAESPAQTPKVSSEMFRDCPDCPEMIGVPAGSFIMGDSAGRAIESETHPVTIKTVLAVGRFEVSFADWDYCSEDGGCLHRPDDKG